MKASALALRTHRRERRVTKGIANPASTVPVGRNGSSDRPGGETISCAVAARVEMVSVDAAAPPFKVTDAGEKLQAAPLGKPEHVKLTVPLKPPLAVSVSVVATDAPGTADPDAGLAAMPKPEVAPPIVMATVLDVLAAYVLSPPY